MLLEKSGEITPERVKRWSQSENNAQSWMLLVMEVKSDCKEQSPWKKSHDRLRQHIKKQRHYFANKSPSSQTCGFSSSHVCCESWTTKKAEHRRTDAFELWCWIRLLRVPWTARRSNQSILKEIDPEYSLE